MLEKTKIPKDHLSQVHSKSDELDASKFNFEALINSGAHVGETIEDD